MCVPSCFTCVLLCGSLDCSPSASSVPEIVQARILEWVVISTFRDQTCISCVSCIDRQILYQLHHLGSRLFLSEICILKLMHVIDKDQSRIFSVPVTSSHSVPTPPCSGSALTCFPSLRKPPHHSSPYLATSPAVLECQEGDSFSSFPIQLQGS